MGNDIITCFNGQECIYTSCKQFNQQLDTCNFKIIGLLDGDGPVQPVEKPVGEQPQRKPELGDKTMIRDLKPGDKSSKEHKINIEGELVYDVEVNTTTTGKRVANPVISDGTGQIRLSYWEEQVSAVENLKKGDKVRIENIWTIDEPYEGTAQAKPGNWSKVIPL